MMHDFLFCRNSRTRQDKLAYFMPMVNLKPYCIPQFGRQLPLVYQSRGVTAQQYGSIYLRHLQVGLQRSRIVHIQDTVRLLFRSSSFAAPLRSLYQDSTLTCQFLCQHLVCNSMLIFHIFNHLIFRHKDNDLFLNFRSWLNFISAVGANSFPQLADFHFLSWQKHKPDVRMIRNKQVLTKGKRDNNGV